jgi:hypothetical protein
MQSLVSQQTATLAIAKDVAVKSSDSAGKSTEVKNIEAKPVDLKN